MRVARACAYHELAAECDFDVSKNVLRSILHPRATSGAQREWTLVPRDDFICT